jgi:hypothetical protein
LNFYKGGDYQDDTAYPGVAVYHEGMDLIAVVSTDEDVWSLRVRGQLMNKTWSNIGVRWEPHNIKGIGAYGGLEVGHQTNAMGGCSVPYGCWESEVLKARSQKRGLESEVSKARSRKRGLESEVLKARS